jgi:hypothetical protein
MRSALDFAIETYPARQQLTSWPSASGRSAGPGGARHLSITIGQRGWNAHPLGGANGLGIPPCTLSAETAAGANATRNRIGRSGAGYRISR